jgi:hypothetical protein
MTYRKKRGVKAWADAAFCGSSEDKARQYGRPERAGWGDFIRSTKLSLS